MTNQAAQTMPVIDDFNGDNAKLIESARALISLSDSGSLAHHGIGGHARAILSAFIVRTEAAALAQTAGVAEGWKLVPVKATEAMQEAFNDWRPTEGNKYAGAQSVSAQDRWEFRQRYAAMLAAAPAASGVDTSTNEAWVARAQEKITAMEAASGGEDEMCPNCVTPWKCNGPHEPLPSASGGEYFPGGDIGVGSPEQTEQYRSENPPPPNTPHPDALPDGTLSKSKAKRLASASVSERDGGSPHSIGGGNWSPWDLFRLSTDMKLPVNLPAEKAMELRRDIERAIEQALTQQRGECEAVVFQWREDPCHDGNWAEWVNITKEDYDRLTKVFDGRETVRLAGRPLRADEDGWPSQIRALYTTPQPSADAVRELVKRWRDRAKSAANGPMFDGASEYAVAGTYIACADELEPLLSGGSHA